jgi:hypothetical protein
VIILVGLGNGVGAGFDAQFSRLANQITISQIIVKSTDATTVSAATKQLTAILDDRHYMTGTT